MIYEMDQRNLAFKADGFAAGERRGFTPPLAVPFILQPLQWQDEPRPTRANHITGIRR
jgi:hypothetical protein